MSLVQVLLIALYGLLIAADAVDKQLPVRVFYAGVDDSLTCGNLPTYSSTPATGYLMILKKP